MPWWHQLPYADAIDEARFAEDYCRDLQLAEDRLEQWQAEHLDDTEPQIRPMTRMENAWMDGQHEIAALELRVAMMQTELNELCMGDDCIIYMGNSGRGRRPYRLSLSHQKHDFEELAKKEGFKVIEKIPVNTRKAETVWGDLSV
jgi:hypothetical protein